MRVKGPNDPLAEALRSLPIPALDERVSERVRALAKAHVAKRSEGGVSLRLTLAGALVPGLLSSAAGAHVAASVTVVNDVFLDGRKPSSDS
jgi:hypothetical protein